MEINIASVAGSRSSWTQSLFTDYQKRFDSSVKVNLINVSPEKRKNKVNNLSKIIEKEGKKLIEKIPDNSINISLDKSGDSWSTNDLYKNFISWKEESKFINFLIGGADGLSKEVIQNSKEVWSLSALTLPHAIVPIIIVEQIYRVWTISKNHPYHR